MKHNRHKVTIFARVCLWILFFSLGAFIKTAYAAPTFTPVQLYQANPATYNWTVNGTTYTNNKNPWGLEQYACTSSNPSNNINQCITSAVTINGSKYWKNNASYPFTNCPDWQPDYDGPLQSADTRIMNGSGKPNSQAAICSNGSLSQFPFINVSKQITYNTSYCANGGEMVLSSRQDPDNAACNNLNPLDMFTNPQNYSQTQRDCLMFVDDEADVTACKNGGTCSTTTFTPSQVGNGDLTAIPAIPPKNLCSLFSQGNGAYTVTLKAYDKFGNAYGSSSFWLTVYNQAVQQQQAGGNITNLNFGISNNNPWFQATCGDIRDDNGITDLLPAGTFADNTSASCTTPGISFTGDANADYGQGQNSSTHQQAGGSSYPEVFSTSSSLNTSYPSLLAKAQNANITPTNLATVCTLSNCTLPNNLPHGIYVATGDVTLNAATLPNNANYVFLINGNLTITGAIVVPTTATALFSTTRNITVAAAVGTPANNANSSLDGWYIAGQNFIVSSAGNCTDLRLNIAGTIVANALGTGGTFQNNRDLCGNDTADPTVSISQRLDMILNAPQFLKQQQTISQEIAP